MFKRFSFCAVALSAAVLCVLSACRFDDDHDPPVPPPSVQCGHPTGVKPQFQTGPFLYVTTQDPQGAAVPGAIESYQVTPNGPMALGSPVPAGIGPGDLGFDAGGQHVYALNRGDGTISQYSVSPSGSLTPLSPATVSVASYPLGSQSYFTVHPSGCFLYVVGILSDRETFAPETLLAQYSIAFDGTLHLLAPEPLHVPGLVMGPLALDAQGRHAYIPVAMSLTGIVAQFSVGADGLLTQLSLASVAPSPISVTLLPQGAYVLNSCVPNDCDGEITQYTRTNSGGLGDAVRTTSLGAGVRPWVLLPDSAGSHAFVLAEQQTGSERTGSLFPYTLSSTGELSPTMPALPTAPAPVGQRGLARYTNDLFVLSATARASTAAPTLPGGHIEHFLIDSVGMVTPLETTALTNGEPTAMALLVYSPADAAY